MKYFFIFLSSVVLNLSVPVFLHAYTYDFAGAVGAPGIWTTGGTTSADAWATYTTGAYEGTTYAGGHSNFSASSSGVDQYAWLKTDITGPINLTFYWGVQRVGMKFYVDGGLRASIAGDTDYILWEKSEHYVGTGTHELRWVLGGSPFASWGHLDAVRYLSIPQLTWTGEANYLSDGLNPETGDRSTAYVYRVKYSDQDGKTPSAGYPKVHIKKSGSEISGSPFQMSYVSPGIYSYSTMLALVGVDYSYYFEAVSSGVTATRASTSTQTGPIVNFSNIPPTLTWTGETNYTSAGLNPGTGDVSTNFVFRVKYADIEGDVPATGHPKLHITKSGSEISGSPFIMNFVSGVYGSGAIFSYTKTLSFPGSDYTYYFEAQDSYNADATGTPLTPVSGPIVSNHAPTLAWTGEANYTANGLNPQSGDRNTSFVFRVKYSDADNQAPNTGYPKLHIKQGGAEITGSPFGMTEADPGDTVYTDGKLYTYTKTLLPGTDYTYYFEAQDSDGVDATGTPTTEIDAPDVTNQAPALVWTAEANYTADGVDPDTAHIGSTFIFRVKYMDYDGDTPASGYPLVHVLKNSAELAGSPFVMDFIAGAPAVGSIYTYSKALTSIGTDYTYYFEAQDAYNAVSTGTSVVIMAGPGVTNVAPALLWTGEANYSAGGLYPLKGNPTDNYVFRVKYADVDNDAPDTGYPRLRIKKSGADISGSPFVMDHVSGANDAGAIYSLSKTLASGDYAYSFDALDLYSGQATGEPLAEQSGPVVIGGELPPAQEVKVYHGVFKPGENEKTNVSFNTATPVTITVTVYNNVGRKVKELYNGSSSAGLNLIQWDGKNESGQRVSSGVYTIKIEGGGINQSKRVVVVR